MSAGLTSSQYFSGTFLGITRHNMQHFTRFCFFGISHCMKEVFGKICVKRCLVQICKPPPGINPIKHEVPPGHFVSTLPHCAQYSTLCIISFLLYNNCTRFPRTRDGVDNGGTVHHLAINNSREMTASKDFKRLKHKNLRHFNIFYQDVICLGHQPTSLGDCCQC